jgi:transcription elongation factor Elf1
MANVDSHEVRFQCPNCGHDLSQTIGQLKAQAHMICSDCGVGINIDTNRLAKSAEEIQNAIEKNPPEISIKFFR